MAIPAQTKEELVQQSAGTPGDNVVTDVSVLVADMVVNERYIVLYRCNVQMTGTGTAKVRVDYVSATTAQPPSTMTILGGTSRTYFWWDVYDTDPVTIREVNLIYEMTGTGTVTVDQCQVIKMSLEDLDEDVDYLVSKNNNQTAYVGPGYEAAQDLFLPAAAKWLVLYRQRFTGGVSGDTLTGRLHQERTSDGLQAANWLSTQHYWNDSAEEVILSGAISIDGNSVPTTVRNEWNDTSGTPSAVLKENAIIAINLDMTARKQDAAGVPAIQIANTGTGGDDFPTSLGSRSLFFETAIGNGLFLGSFVIHPNESAWKWKTQSQIEGTANPTDQAFADLLACGPIVSNVGEQYLESTMSYLQPSDGTKNYEVLAGGDTAVSPPSSAERKLLEYALSVVRLDFGLSVGTGVKVQSFPQNGGGYSTTANSGPPVWTVPGAQGVTLSSTLTLQAANSNAITITEPDAATMACTLTVTNGTVALGSPGSVTGVTGDGTASISWTGNAADTITALEGSVFTPPAGHLVGDTYTLSLTADDQHPSDPQTGNGGFSIFVQAAPPAAPTGNSEVSVNFLENELYAGGKFIR